MIVMPTFGDQTLNAQVLKKQGVGVILKLREVTKEALESALKEALSPK